MGLAQIAVPTGTELKVRAFGFWSVLADALISGVPSPRMGQGVGSQERAPVVRWRHVGDHHLSFSGM